MFFIPAIVLILFSLGELDFASSNETFHPSPHENIRTVGYWSVFKQTFL